MFIAEKMTGKSQAKFTVEHCPDNKTQSAQTLNHRTNRSVRRGSGCLKMKKQTPRMGAPRGMRDNPKALVFE
jgi:hypothetical protein